MFLFFCFKIFFLVVWATDRKKKILQGNQVGRNRNRNVCFVVILNPHTRIFFVFRKNIWKHQQKTSLRQYDAWYRCRWRWFKFFLFVSPLNYEDRMVLFKFKNKQKQQQQNEWIERNQNGQLDVQCWRMKERKKAMKNYYEMKEKVVFVFCIEYRRWWIPSMFNWIQSIFFGLQKKDCRWMFSTIQSIIINIVFLN